jgi:hypothetical protein
MGRAGLSAGSDGVLFLSQSEAYVHSSYRELRHHTSCALETRDPLATAPDIDDGDYLFY